MSFVNARASREPSDILTEWNFCLELRPLDHEPVGDGPQQ